jgi:hypothetical protein
MSAQRALGFAGGTAGVIQCRDIVGARQITWCDRAYRDHRGQEVDAVAGSAKREQTARTGYPGCEVGAAIPERVGIDNQNLGVRILDLKQLVLKRSQGMQPGDREPRQLRGDARAPGVGAVGGQELHARAGLQAQLHKNLLDAADQFGGAAIGERSARPAERGPIGIARQRPQCLSTDGRKRMKGIGHVSSK